MRGLNPRAWSIDGECWCARVDYDGYEKEWSGIAPVFAPDNRNKRLGEIEDTNIVVEFPTGLKDKNDKEIYDGDILRWANSTGREITAPVVWNTRAWCWTAGDYMLGGLLEFDLEVVGNIHEDLKLLEAK